MATTLTAAPYMKAGRLIQPGLLRVDELPTPEPAGGELLVKVLRASICGSDVHRVYGGFHDALPSGPGWPGHEGVGRVVAGSNGECGPGDLVLLLPGAVDNGTYAEYMVSSPQEVIPLPAGLPVPSALMAQQLGTVVFALKRFWTGAPEDTAVILGAGSAGLYFLQLVKTLGFKQTVIADVVPSRLEAARDLGAEVVVDANREKVVDVVADLTAGAGADFAIEAAGRKVTRTQAVDLVRKFGRVGCFGHAEALDEDAFPFEPAWRKCLEVRFAVGAMFEPGLLSFREAVRQIQSGSVRIDHLEGREFMLQELPRAMNAARDREAIKIHVAIAQDSPA
jgi:L-iditol 2-dehydrogenase